MEEPSKSWDCKAGGTSRHVGPRARPLQTGKERPLPGAVLGAPWRGLTRPPEPPTSAAQHAPLVGRALQTHVAEGVSASADPPTSILRKGGADAPLGLPSRHAFLEARAGFPSARDAEPRPQLLLRQGRSFRFAARLK